MKNTILALDHKQALQFFLKHENYFDVQLPIYFNATHLLNEINTINMIGEYSMLNKSQYKHANLIVYVYKADGRKRPLTIINPILYVALVQKLATQNAWRQFVQLFDFYKTQKKIQCHSLPITSSYRKFLYDKAKQIMNWYDNFEQQSIKLSLHYSYMATADIQNFYPSIQSKILTKALAQSKSNELNSFAMYCQNFLDKTCAKQGFPQGNNLFHILADVILLAIDKKLHKRIKKHKIKSYQILRYRDDYRIFANNKKDAESILIILQETLNSFGLAYNASKTAIHSDIISHSTKDDKQHWLTYDIMLKQHSNNTPTHKLLLIIKRYSNDYPNTSGVQRGLNIVYRKLKEGLDFVDKKHLVQITAITLDIAKYNPRWTAYCLQVIDIISSYIDKESQLSISRIIHKKLIHKNTDFYVFLWIQRFVYKLDKNGFGLKFNNPLALYAHNPCNHLLWNFSFNQSKALQKIIKNNPIVDFSLIDKDWTLTEKELNLFHKNNQPQFITKTNKNP